MIIHILFNFVIKKWKNEEKQIVSRRIQSNNILESSFLHFLVEDQLDRAFSISQPIQKRKEGSWLVQRKQKRIFASQIGVRIELRRRKGIRWWWMELRGIPEEIRNVYLHDPLFSLVSVDIWMENWIGHVINTH